MNRLRFNKAISFLPFAIGTLLFLAVDGVFGVILLLCYFVTAFCIFTRAKELTCENNFLYEKKRNMFVLCKELQFKLEHAKTLVASDAYRDQLTGLYNLRGFIQCIESSIKVKKGDDQYHVICFDLFDYEQFLINTDVLNEDKIIEDAADKLKNAFAASTPLSRYDCYKFMLGISGSELVLERTIEVLANIFKKDSPPEFFAQNYIGVASYPQDASSVFQLIKKAEKNLYTCHKNIHMIELKEQRHLEQLSAAGELAAGLAHEIRNPLQALRGFVQILTRDNEDFKKWEHIILPEIDRINELVRRFLHLGESQDKQLTKVNLNCLIQNIITLLTSGAELEGHEIVARMPKYLVNMEANAEQLKQVLINLIKNSLESFTKKHGRINILWKEKQRKIYLRIQDNGAGIADIHLPNIFNPFFTTKEEGTGMGLAICRKIIEEHGGTIEVSSKSGLGTVFNIEFPVRQRQKKAELVRV